MKPVIMIIRSKVNKGGPGSLISSVIGELINRGYNIIFVVGGGEYVENIQNLGAQCYVRDNLLVEKRNLLKIPADILMIRGLVKNNNVSAIFGFNPGATIIGYLATRLMKRKVSIASAVLGVGKEWIQKYLPFKLVSMSEGHKAVMVARGVPASKIFVNYPSTLNKNIFNYDNCDYKYIRAELGLTDNDILIGTVMNGKKGREDYYKIIEPILRKYKNLYLLFVGNTTVYERIEKDFILSDLKDKVFFLGYRTDIPAIMKSLDIYSHLVDEEKTIETFGMVLTEAMIMKTPVIATNIGGIRDIVLDGKTGYLVKNIDEYRARLEYLLSDKRLRSEMGELARERALNFFTLENSVDILENILYHADFRKL